MDRNLKKKCEEWEGTVQSTEQKTRKSMGSQDLVHVEKRGKGNVHTKIYVEMLD